MNLQETWATLVGKDVKVARKRLENAQQDVVRKLDLLEGESRALAGLKNLGCMMQGARVNGGSDHDGDDEDR